MIDFSALPDVSETNLELTEPGEIEYAAQMLARENLLHAVFGQPEPNGRIWSPSDPNLTINWAGGGFYTYPAASGGYYFVTSGLSQPAPDQLTQSDGKDAFSGLGLELVIQSPDDSKWPFGVLQGLVNYMLFQENARIVMPGDRIPCNGPLVTDSDTDLCYLIAALSDRYETQGRLPAGNVDLVQLIGVTEGEANHATAWGRGTGGTLILGEVLKRLKVDELTDPNRSCTTLDSEFDAIWSQVMSELEAKWRDNGWDGQR